MFVEQFYEIIGFQYLFERGSCEFAQLVLVGLAHIFIKLFDFGNTPEFFL
jgi:hypothetical protein